ncbi:MAG: energy-coupling factor transporter transmembrane protein EcfT [Dialister invisus]|jgi:putative membrane protein|uniref:Energy-coupling factor transporter transmembrane protein EcfT n=1 Tax=Dialister invisus TaxID=218538 RepID=A0A930FRS7_9FIRM|nr:energy-coupling factor transporter transmembrane protein EcfT [Lachnospiraceae bacterium]MBF1021947.1 energy-coupling factor transporter transmembrane protein EcfT [Lachnospiraceae bacterium]MBF1129858.1 energy-coupling factor transporter transmembrane protein EcfT [Dialister invisus]
MMEKREVKFDLRTKFMLILVVNLFLLLSHSVIFELVLIFGCLLLITIDGQAKSAFHFLIVFLIMLGIDQLLTPYINGFFFTLVSFITVALRKFLPCFILGKWILTKTEVSEFVAVMWKLRLPQTAIIPLSVVFRYFPTIKEEWASIRAAMKMRGIHVSLEHIMVPLLMSAVNVSEELSAAALCRGLDSPEPHTSLVQVRFRFSDVLVWCITGALAIAAIILKGVGIL